MTESNRSTESTSVTEEPQSAAEPFEVTPEMTSLDEAIMLMDTNPNWFQPIPANILDSTFRPNADNLPAAMLYVLYGRPRVNGGAVTPELVVTALKRMGVSRFDIFGPILAALGSQRQLDELISLANSRQQQLSNEQLAPLTSADVHETLMEIAKLVITFDEIRHLITGIALLGATQGLADYISRLAMNDALDISEPKDNLPTL